MEESILNRFIDKYLINWHIWFEYDMILIDVVMMKLMIIEIIALTVDVVYLFNLNFKS